MTLLEVLPQSEAIANGLNQSVVGVGVVFVVLAFLFLTFLGLSNFMERQALKKMEKKGQDTKSVKATGTAISGDENAAIATALYIFFNEMHDEESGIITINKIQRRYSPWSSKIYNMNNVFRKN